MRILHVIGGISRASGGPARSSQGLVAGLRAAGVDAWLMTLHKSETPWVKGVDRFVNGEPFEEALDKVKPDIVHLHGIWDVRLHRCAVICRRRKIPYVIAPRGMLEPWSLKQKWLKKRVARFLYQDRDLKKAAALHATAESEAEQFRKLGFKNNVIVSPNGVNVPEGKCLNVGIGECLNGDEKKIGVENRCTAEFFDSGRAASMRPPHGGESGAVGVRALPERDNSTVHLFSTPIFSPYPHRSLFVSRMHPKKGVLELVESWARVRQTGMVVQNRITANWYDVVPADEILGLPMVEVCPSTSRFADKRALKDLFKSFGQVENRSDGRRVTFPAKSVGKMMGQKGVDLYRLAGAFADLFRASRRAWSESEASIEDHKQHRNIDAYHQYIAKFTDGTDECFVRFTVREDKGGRLARNEIHSSTVSRIIVYKAKGAELSNLGHAQAEDSTPFVDNKISYFLNRVNPLANWQCELVYTLNGDTEREYEAKVKQRVKELGLDDQFIFTGPLNDDQKWAAYARADLFILPTYSENFGIVVAEALWAGVPVITTKGTPWSELVSHRCGWWIDLPGEEKKIDVENRCTADGSVSCGDMGLVGRDPRARRSQKDQSVHNSSLLTSHSTLVAWPALDAALREATSGARGARALPRGGESGALGDRALPESTHLSSTSTSNFNSSQSNNQTIKHSNISLCAMGANGHALVEAKYTWPAVVKAMIHGYEQILKDGR